ncbi:MAG: hypothetical protein ACI4UM_06020 [Succinivibrio sp.]
MLDFDSLPEDKQVSLIDDIQNLFTDFCEQVLFEQDAEAYKRISKFYFDNDYIFVIGFREITEADEEFIDPDTRPSFVAEIVYEAEKGSLKNDIHVADLYCSFEDDSNSHADCASVNFFPEGE